MSGCGAVMLSVSKSFITPAVPCAEVADSHHGGSGLFPTPVHMEFVVKRVILGQVFSTNLRCFLSVSFNQLFVDYNSNF
jgi:hypothetical protein